MNKKGIIGVLVIIVIVFIGYKSWGGSSAVDNSSTVTPVAIPAGVTKDTYAPVTKDTVDTSLLGRLKSASVAAAETDARVALVNGKAQFTSDSVKGSITLGDSAVAKSFGGVNYAITTLGVTTGTVASQYAVLFVDNAGTLTDKSYALIGSGAKVSGLRADEVAGGLVVTITFTDVDGKSHNKILVIENGMFNSAKELNL